MSSVVESKHGTVSRPPYELYMAFTDMRNFLKFIPEDKKEGVTADSDSIHATVQGFNVGVMVSKREPYKEIDFEDDGAPFEFSLSMHFDTVQDMKTDFYMTFDAELNLMMRMLIGNKVKEAMDKLVDGLVDMSNGNIPEGMPENFKF